MLLRPVQRAAAVLLLFWILFAGETSFAQGGGSPRLHLSVQPEAISLRLSDVPEVGDEVWVLQFSCDLETWEDLAIFAEPAAPGADLVLELAGASVPPAAGGQLFFRARPHAAGDKQLAEFLAARDRWRRSGIDRYHMELSWFVSFFEWRGTVDVDRGEVTAWETLSSSFFEPPEPRTMDDWFDHLKFFIDRPSDRIDVTYDPVFGYPRSVYIDDDFRIADEEQSWVVHEFLPAR